MSSGQGSSAVGGRGPRPGSLRGPDAREADPHSYVGAGVTSGTSRPSTSVSRRCSATRVRASPAEPGRHRHHLRTERSRSVSDVIEVTGDLLAHRRWPRAWAYEKHVGMYPYEQVQAMEGHLIHHAMEWLTKQHRESGTHASRGGSSWASSAVFPCSVGSRHSHRLPQQGRGHHRRRRHNPAAIILGMRSDKPMLLRDVRMPRQLPGHPSPRSPPRSPPCRPRRPGSCCRHRATSRRPEYRPASTQSRQSARLAGACQLTCRHHLQRGNPVDLWWSTPRHRSVGDGWLVSCL
jgi:hypothetical protein